MDRTEKFVEAMQKIDEDDIFKPYSKEEAKEKGYFDKNAAWAYICQDREDDRSKTRWLPLIKCMAQVWNGGFSQWYRNGYGREEAATVRGLLEELNTPAAKRMLDLVIKSRRYKQDLEPYRDRNGELQDNPRRDLAEEKLGLLDDMFYDDLDNELVADFAKKLGYKEGD